MNNISDGYGEGVYRSGTISEYIIVATEENPGGGVKFSSGLIGNTKIINNKGVVGHSGASFEEGIYLKVSLY